MMLAELAADQASTPVTAQQAHTTTTPTRPNVTMATLSQVKLVLSPSALGQADGSLINFELAGQIQKSAAISDNANDVSDGWLSDTERQSAFHIPPAHEETVDSVIGFYFRDDRSPAMPRPFRYESRHSSRAPSRRSAMFDFMKQLVDKFSVDAERQRADMHREMSLELDVARLRSFHSCRVVGVR